MENPGLNNGENEGAPQIRSDLDLLGILVTDDLVGAKDRLSPAAKTRLLESGNTPEELRQILLPLAEREFKCECDFKPNSKEKFNANCASDPKPATITGLGKMLIQNNLITINGHAPASWKRQIFGTILSVIVGGISFLIWGLIEGMISGSKFGFGVGGATFFVFQWWNFAKGMPVSYCSHVSSRRLVYEKLNASFRLELDDGSWVHFKIADKDGLNLALDLGPHSCPISPLARLRVLFGDRFSSWGSIPK